MRWQCVYYWRSLCKLDNAFVLFVKFAAFLTVPGLNQSVERLTVEWQVAGSNLWAGPILGVLVNNREMKVLPLPGKRLDLCVARVLSSPVSSRSKMLFLRALTRKAEIDIVSSVPYMALRRIFFLYFVYFHELYFWLFEKPFFYDDKLHMGLF